MRTIFIFSIFVFIFRKTDNEILFEPFELSSPLHLEMIKAQVQTMADVFKWCISKYGNQEVCNLN